MLKIKCPCCGVTIEGRLSRPGKMLLFFCPNRCIDFRFKMRQMHDAIQDGRFNLALAVEETVLDNAPVEGVKRIQEVEINGNTDRGTGEVVVEDSENRTLDIQERVGG